ncbi:hypothetical protein EJ02DRAFT_332474 [Clathrospora elynae]|uniref:Cyclin-like protein n=1 Tax=Clathrospora elynae TaxID=706981 RepID=A0A6A5TB80_9PLEO|nr:hypothetical protein EJ02DRAFT_332474 [Clathrospora elynae]
MPSFYPRHQVHTPPEFVPSYHSACGASYQQQNAYAGPAIRQQDDGYDFADRYGQLAIAMPSMYPQAGTYLSSAPLSLPPASSFYDSTGPTALPPLRAQSGHSMAEAAMQQQRAQDYNQRAHQPAKEEKPVGGVSAKLDYDMNVMTDFVCDTALRLITPGRMMPSTFRSWVHQVLCATRLPSATILLSMFYLSNRMPMLSHEPKTDTHLFRLLTIALVLGSKFLDDNTFINRSWSEVSGIQVHELNDLELEWLLAIKFKLHRDPTEQQGWTSWSEHWKDYQSTAAARAGRSNKLSPIDTSVQRRSLNPNKPLPPLPMQQAYNLPPYEYTPKSAQPAYNLPAYSQYDPWRSASEYSPASAPTTGPTTPEYYGTAGTWGPVEGYSRRTMFGFPPLPQPAPAQAPQQQSSNYRLSAYTTQYNPSAWNQHGLSCGCAYCVQRHPPYFMAPGYGPQAVAV